MNIRSHLSILILAVISLLSSCQKGDPTPPNIVLIFADDLGYGDLSCFGAQSIHTPKLDALANKGMTFTDFHSTSATCTSSRASLLTGCYPDRVSLPKVLFPNGAWGSNPNIGLNPEEETIAELLKQKGYATAMAGKWHLGHKQMFLPLQHGFDHYLGVPYSNDMPIEPTMALAENIRLRNGFTRDMILNFDSLEMPKKNHQTPLLRDNEVIEFPADQSTLTQRYTQFCTDFIVSQANNSPFFVYLAYTMPHIPIFASDQFLGKSKGGLYGDVIEEIDWSVGEIIKTLEESGVLENTLVIFTSDNGPWLSYGNHGGSAGPLRGGKFDSWEGGFRVPAIMSWPDLMTAGSTSDQLVSTLDILPTLVEIAGATLPVKKIDGQSILPLLKGQTMETLDQRYFYYFKNTKLNAVRKGAWKYVIPHRGGIVTEPGKDGVNGKGKGVDFPEALYDLDADIAEQNNVMDAHPGIVQELKTAGETFATMVHREARPIGVNEVSQ
ncbi:MAG: sulfatase [Bacteroidota bacterium]